MGGRATTGGWTRGACLAAAAAGLLLLLGAPRAEATNGPKLTSSGARAAGRGGVDYAFADDAIGPANNPAGMAWVYGNRLDQYWAIADPRASWSNEFGRFKDRDNLFIAVPAFSFGVFFDPFKSWEVAPIFDIGNWGLKPKPGEVVDEGGPLDIDPDPLGSRLRVGFGVFPVTGGRVQLKKMRTRGFADPLDWEVDTLALAVTPSLAIRVTNFFSIGLNLQFHYSKFELDGGIAQPRTTLAESFRTAAVLLNDNPQIVTKADIDDAFTYGFSWRIGFMFHLHEMLSAAFVYQDRSYSADYLGRATVSGDDEVRSLTNGNPSLLQIVDSRVDPSLGFESRYDLRLQDYDQPRHFGLGLAFRPHRRLSLGLDYTYICWRERFKEFKARLSNGTNPNLDIMTSPSVKVRVPLKFRDQSVIAVGLSALVAEGQDIVEGVPAWSLVVRTGYNYGRSPVPRRTTLPQLPVINEHHVSAGFSFHWGPLVEFSVAAEYALPREISTGSHKGDFTLSGAKQEVSILFVQFGMGFNF